MTVSDKITIVTTSVSLVIWIIAVVVATLARRGNKKAQALLKPVQCSSLILSKLPSYINQAEEMFGAGHGSAKLGWVVQQVYIDCIRSGLSAEIEVDQITEQIEAILSTPHKKEATNHGSDA